MAASASLLIILMKECLKRNEGQERHHTDIIDSDCQKASVTVFHSNLFFKKVSPFIWERLLTVMDQTLIKRLDRQNKWSVFILAKAK